VNSSNRSLPEPLPKILRPPGDESSAKIRHMPDGQSVPSGFHTALSWSHYRALIGVGKLAARDFYESEAAQCGSGKLQLERQIATLYYEPTSSVSEKPRNDHGMASRRKTRT